jgi:type I restriction enzyme S subunit
MFGNPATNPLGWPVVSVGDLFNHQRGGAKCGPFGSALKKHEYLGAGIPVWGIANVSPNQFVEPGSLFIPSDKFEELRAYAVEPGDLLISRAGTVGRICVATPTVKDSIIGTNLIRIAFDHNRVVPDFFSALLTHFASDAGRLRANMDEGAYSFMNTTVLKTLRIYLPPLSLQKDFAQRVADIRAMEAGQAVSRQRLEALFRSMLHQAFAGRSVSDLKL